MQKTAKKRWEIALMALAVLVALSAPAVWAQETKEDPDLKSALQEEGRSTLIGGDFKARWFVDLGTKIASFDDNTIVLMGGGVGLTFNHAFSIGFAGWGKADFEEGSWHSDHDGCIWDDSSLDWKSTDDVLYGYGGLYLAYNLLPTKAVFGRVSLLLGAGGKTHRGIHGICEDAELDHNVFWVAEPAVDLGVNIAPFMRLTLGLSYPIIDKKMSELERIHVAFGLQIGK